MAGWNTPRLAGFSLDPSELRYTFSTYPDSFENMNKASLHSVLAVCCLAVARTAAAQQPTDQPLYLAGPQIPLEQRVDSLIASMTLEEKASQLGNVAPAIPRLQLPRYNWWNEGLHGVARAGVATVFPQAIGMAATFDAPLLVFECADLAQRRERLQELGVALSRESPRGVEPCDSLLIEAPEGTLLWMLAVAA